MESQMMMSRYVYGCTLSTFTPTAEPETPPTPADALPHSIADQVIQQMNDTNAFPQLYNIRDISVIDGNEF